MSGQGLVGRPLSGRTTGEVELFEKRFVLAPGGDIGQRVGAAEENRSERRRLRPEAAQSVDREVNARMLDLERRDTQPRSVLGGEVEHLEAVVAGGQGSVGLVGRIRAGEEQHAVEPERSERVAGQREMAAMNRVERASEDANRRHGRGSSRAAGGASPATTSAAARSTCGRPSPVTAETA
jgi:hypothetical protein